MDKDKNLGITSLGLWMKKMANWLNPQERRVIPGFMPLLIHSDIREISAKKRVIHGFHRAYYYDYINEER